MAVICIVLVGGTISSLSIFWCVEVDALRQYLYLILCGGGQMISCLVAFTDSVSRIA